MFARWFLMPLRLHHNCFIPGNLTSRPFALSKIECLKQGADDVSYLVGGAGAGGYGDIISPPTGAIVGARGYTDAGHRMCV